MMDKEQVLREVKAAMLDGLLAKTEMFATDEDINGADWVEAFATWRAWAVDRIQKVEAAYESQ